MRAESAAQRRMRTASAHAGLKGQRGERVWGWEEALWASVSIMRVLILKPWAGRGVARRFTEGVQARTKSSGLSSSQEWPACDHLGRHGFSHPRWSLHAVWFRQVCTLSEIIPTWKAHSRCSFLWFLPPRLTSWLGYS